MTKHLKIFTLLITSFLFLTPYAFAQTNGKAAFVFGYYPNEGQKVLFNKGYQRHLNWHKEHHDPLPWYGWYVIKGKRTGMFIDGSFGIPFKAFDHRVDIEEDGADAEKNVLPFSTPIFQKAYVLRKDLSTGTPLENFNPFPHIQVTFYKLKPGMAKEFEHVLKVLKSEIETVNDIPTITSYELVVGDSHPTFMLMVNRKGWASYADFRGTIVDVITNNFNSDKAQSLLDELSQSVDQNRSEVWSYRSDLSSLPDE